MTKINFVTFNKKKQIVSQGKYAYMLLRCPCIEETCSHRIIAPPEILSISLNRIVAGGGKMKAKAFTFPLELNLDTGSEEVTQH
jgi:hypothetical protein